jgi:hypothetical protein
MIKKLLRRWKYGEEVIIVSGLPRSGTSMMMKMLEAGGLSIMTDGLRTADEDNPKGYYEFERVKNLEQETDKSYVSEARGKVLKVISHLLKELPDDNFYRVLFMLRDLNEVVASQNKMLERRNEPNPVSDDKARELYAKHLMHVKFHLQERPNFELLEVGYKDALDNPADAAQRVNRFLDNRLDPEKMTETIDPNLYRNRKDQL